MTKSRDEDGALILLVEDEYFIALDLREVLAAAGYRVLGPAASVAEAFSLLHDARPDAALLDVNLRGERVSSVAHLLRAMDVPFLLASAQEDFPAAGDEVLRDAENLGKPVDEARLRRSLHQLVGSHA